MQVTGEGQSIHTGMEKETVPPSKIPLEARFVHRFGHVLLELTLCSNRFAGRGWGESR